MAGKGSFLGGSTVVGPGSDWFTYDAPKAKRKAKSKPRIVTPEEKAKKEADRILADEKRRQRAEEKQHLAKERKGQEDASRAAKIESRRNPELAARRRADMVEKMDKVVVEVKKPARSTRVRKASVT